MKVRFEVEKETKNTIRFKEVQNASGPLVIGTLYVQKQALREINYLPNHGLVVTLEVDNGK